MLISNDFAGTLWRHTPKAIKRAQLHGAGIETAPANRVFAVVGIVDDGYLLAWKLEELKDGWFKHPAFKRPLKAGSHRLFIEKGRNGETPTAMFRPDSHYQQIKE